MHNPEAPCYSHPIQPGLLHHEPLLLQTLCYPITPVYAKRSAERNEQACFKPEKSKIENIDGYRRLIYSLDTYFIRVLLRWKHP
ncbi:hypothetical protein D3C75_912230 [compost metagenome]